jgi:hypothetical protein
MYDLYLTLFQHNYTHLLPISAHVHVCVWPIYSVFVWSHFYLFVRVFLFVSFTSLSWLNFLLFILCALCESAVYHAVVMRGFNTQPVCNLLIILECFTKERCFLFMDKTSNTSRWWKLEDSVDTLLFRFVKAIRGFVNEWNCISLLLYYQLWKS